LLSDDHPCQPGTGHSSWGQPWGRAVDERGTSSPSAGGAPRLGTTACPVPTPFLTVPCRLSWQDHRSSTCPQDLWLRKVSLFLHLFEPIAWGQCGKTGSFLRDSVIGPGPCWFPSYPQVDVVIHSIRRGSAEKFPDSAAARNHDIADAAWSGSPHSREHPRDSYRLGGARSCRVRVAPWAGHRRLTRSDPETAPGAPGSGRGSVIHNVT
jgi:hypothetical protein